MGCHSRTDSVAEFLSPCSSSPVFWSHILSSSSYPAAPVNENPAQHRDQCWTTASAGEREKKSQPSSNSAPRPRKSPASFQPRRAANLHPAPREGCDDTESCRKVQLGRCHLGGVTRWRQWREAVSGGCVFFGEWFGTGAARLEERRGRGAPCKASALLRTPAPYRHMGGKSQLGFLSFIHLAMVSCLAVVYQLNKLKTV